VTDYDYLDGQQIVEGWDYDNLDGHYFVEGWALFNYLMTV
jgi:hypothetical protein